MGVPGWQLVLGAAPLCQCCVFGHKAAGLVREGPMELQLCAELHMGTSATQGLARGLHGAVPALQEHTDVLGAGRAVPGLFVLTSGVGCQICCELLVAEIRRQKRGVLFWASVATEPFLGVFGSAHFCDSGALKEPWAHVATTDELP